MDTIVQSGGHIDGKTDKMTLIYNQALLAGVIIILLYDK